MELSSLNFILKEMEKTTREQNSSLFRTIGDKIVSLQSTIREAIQSATKEKIKEIIDKIKRRQRLTDADVELIKLWIVGDAASYVEAENNFQDWIAEFNRLRSVLSTYSGLGEFGVNELIGLQGILEDLKGVCFDIANFLEKQERVDRFNSAFSQPDSIDYDVLLEILTSKLRSPNY